MCPGYRHWLILGPPPQKKKPRPTPTGAGIKVQGSDLVRNQSLQTNLIQPNYIQISHLWGFTSLETLKCSIFVGSAVADTGF